MSAAGFPIDTLSFEDLLRLALEDVPGSSSGQWTLHGPVDPGIAFLELFAWQYEQRLFMAEQLTEPIVRAGLRLLGLADPAPALAAVTVLAVSAQSAPAHLPAGTVFGLDDDVAGRRFALDHDVWVQPVDGARASGRLLADGDVLELALTGDTSVAGSGGTLSLLVELPAVDGVSAAWRRAAAYAPGPAELRWSALGPDGSEAPVDVSDGTGALRRSGLLRLPWPDVWDRPGGEPRRLRATAVRASYTEPVAVVAVHANAAVARHRVPAAATPSLAGFLPLPGQQVTIEGAAAQLCDGDGEVVLSLSEHDGERHDWRSVRTWVGHGPGARVFVVDRDRGELRFGDGRRGRVPRPADVPDATVTYALGAGAAGNLGRSCTWSQEGGAALATNPVPAEDGADPEQLDAARQRAADALALRDRTVTAEDARELAESTPGVAIARAHVTPGLHPGFPCDPVPGAIAVTVVPYADRSAEPADWTLAPEPDTGALEAVRARLEGARLLGQEVFVLEPRYRRVTVDATVSALSGSGDAGERIVSELRTYLDPLKGGSEHTGWPFGGPVRPSALVGVAQDAAGPEATVTRLTVALDDEPPSDCGDLAIGERELVSFGAATVTWVAVAPPGGGLQ